MGLCCSTQKTKAKQNEEFLEAEQSFDAEKNANPNGATQKERVAFVTDCNDTSNHTPTEQQSDRQKLKNNTATHVQTCKAIIKTQDKVNNDIEIITTDDKINHNKTSPNRFHNHQNAKPKTTKLRDSLQIKLTSNDGTFKIINAPPIIQQYNSTTIIISDENASNKSNKSNKAFHELKSQLNTKQGNTSYTQNAETTIANLRPWPGPRSSVKMRVSETDSFDADHFDINQADVLHEYGASVQIHEVNPSDQKFPSEAMVLTPDALPIDTLAKHLLSDSVESLDPDFILEPAYFESSEVYSMSRESSREKYDYSDEEDEHKQQHINNHSLTAGPNWTMPGVSIDHTASIQMLQSMEMFAAGKVHNGAIGNAQNIGQSVQYDAVPNTNKNIGKSIQYTAPDPASVSAVMSGGKNIGQSVQYTAAPKNIGQSIQYTGVKDTVLDTNAVGKSVQMAAAASMGGEQFIMWQMHGRKLKNMSHKDLVTWLSNSGFDKETLAHFEKYKIDGRKLWQNIRNASMFLYNVGVVRPTLRDAIVQNIYLELLPKTPGFDERHMVDFKNLKLIADGPISTVYKANIQKEKLNLRESRVIVKGYHFAADDVRVGKIIQILVHMVTNISSSRFVKIHGFIRNMMEGNTNNSNNVHGYQRPMFGIVMEYCDGGSIRSAFKDGNKKQYDLLYNIMDKIGILQEVAMAMSELHAQNTLHRNIKASNVLISNNDDIKLTDYCLDVTQLTDFTHSLDAKERSMRWMSPELIKTQNYTKACDIYSFGITCYEILSGRKPYHTYSNGNGNLLRKIISENLRPDIDELANLPEDLLVLMSNCWHENIKNRPNDFDEIIDELIKIKENLRAECITFDDIYARARVSMMSDFKKNAKGFQSSPLLTMQNDLNSDEDEYAYDIQRDVQQQLQNQLFDDYDNDSDDDIKFEQLLQPYKSRPTHVKDDTALELDKIKKFEPKRRKLHAKKRRPRKPLPKAPPVNKELPTMDNDTVNVNDKQVHLPDKPLPPKPLE